MRLARALAAAGVCSRREAEDHIRAGRVSVNGDTITDVATNVDPLHDALEHDGQRVYLERPRTLVLYKPEGVITSVGDTHGRQTVRDLLPHVKERVYPVGRLDVDTSGVLLLTNDGDLAYRLTHPKYEIKKIYRAWVEGKPSDTALRRLARGVTLDTGEARPARAHVSIIRGVKGGSVLRFKVHEGRKHEIKRLCEKIGHPCTRLVREKFAGVDLSGLSPGQSRDLDFKEVRRLRKMTGLVLDPKAIVQELDARLAAEQPGESAVPATPAVDASPATPTADATPAAEAADVPRPRPPAPKRPAAGTRSRPDETSRRHPPPRGRKPPRAADRFEEQAFPRSNAAETEDEARSAQRYGPVPPPFDARRARREQEAEAAAADEPVPLPKAKRRKRGRERAE